MTETKAGLTTPKTTRWVPRPALKPQLLVSVSGGKSSMYMAKRLRDANEYNMRFVFANTGQEWEETLSFVHRCEVAWGLPITWVEAVTHSGRIGCTHRIVDYTTASRTGEPFADVIGKYGIPNMKYPHCTRELKLNPIRSFMASVGWAGYLTAVGIRKDEPKRIRKTAKAAGIIYPLFDHFPIDKAGVNDWWEEQEFNLNLLERQGNCTWCWKKSLTKHMLIAKETPEVYEFPRLMEEQHGVYPDGARRTFFRGNRSAEQIITMSQILNPSTARPEWADEDAGCSESCEAFGQDEVV